MVSDAESTTTERKRAERLQQNTRVRSRSTAVTHSIGGSIHSGKRGLNSRKKKRGRGAPPPQKKPYRQHGEYHSDERRAASEEIPPGRSASSGLRSAVPSAPAVGGLVPADRSPSAAPYTTPVSVPLLRPRRWISGLVRDPQRLQPCLCSVRGAESIPAL